MRKRFLNNILDNATMLSLVVMSIGWLYIVIKNLNSPDIIILSLFGSVLCLVMILYAFLSYTDTALDVFTISIIFFVEVMLITIAALSIIKCIFSVIKCIF